ncbi:MAG: penicillin-binding protein 2, partial [Alphaproteobacteria bacterium]|nr:penicillin-binding protein 2 [Alphaproteobacteria bacterium]
MITSKRTVSSAMLQNSFDRRTTVLGALQGVVGVVLAGRLTWLAVAQNEKYELLAESNRVNLTLTPPRRGWILDRDGRPLASNKADFRVDVIPERLRNRPYTIAELRKLLSLSDVQVRELEERLKKASGFAPVEVASGLEWNRFAAVSLRLPDLPGVVTQRGFSRDYPTGPSVGHLIGYVGVASREEWEAENKAPILITPGFKIGKDGLEKSFDATLQGKPGARRVEVTSGGRIVRDLDTREDVPGKPLKLTINGQLQDYAARRIGLESGAVVVIDCHDGGILALASMPSFDPNSFADGVGSIEWKMLNEDDHIPLLNKAVRGLYPPGSTMKPMVSLALLTHGIDPEERVPCPGGYRLGSRFFRCDAVHGSVNMRQAIEHSCNTYFWAMSHRVGYDVIAPVARMLGLGQEYDLPGTNQRYGTVPDAAWKKRKYGQEWTAADSLNASIGQGYVLSSPLQLAVMTARIASGRNFQPSLLLDKVNPDAPTLPFAPEQLAVVREGMYDVVNGSGTARRLRIDIDGVKMAGKTGTAQVRTMVSRGTQSDWKSRDHALFVSYAPADNPRYAMAVVVEHGTFGARTAAPIARDVFTFLFDPDSALATLHDLERQWGGTARERLDRKYATYSAHYASGLPTEEPDGEGEPDHADEPDDKPSAQATPQAAPSPAATEPPANESDVAPALPAPTPSPVTVAPSPVPASAP